MHDKSNHRSPRKPGPPFEYDGLPGFELRPWKMPWWSNTWTAEHGNPRRRHDVWSPLTWEGRTWVENVLALDQCAYCDNPCEVIDHVVPLASGGNNDWTNLTAACRKCNQSKSATPLLLFLIRRAEKAENSVRLAEHRRQRDLGMLRGAA